MTKEQISLIRNVAQQDDGTGKPLAGVLSAIFNDEIMFRNTDDFLIYDDNNELIHAIKANYDNAIAGAAWPYKIATGFYGNIQFMEGLYTMSNFEKAVDQLFLDTGLIDEDKKEMIMKWANGIRNHAMQPIDPGPYYPSVPQIPPMPPRPEVRPDGIWHAEPIDQRTKKNIIFNLVDRAIENASNGTFNKVRPAAYKLSYDCDNETMANTFKGFMDTLGKELFYASLTNDVKAAIIDPRVEASTDNFVTIAAEEILPTERDIPVNIKMYIEAYGVRVRYDFRTTKVIDQEAADEWLETTQAAVEQYVNSFNNDAVESANINGTTISAAINTTDGLESITLAEDLASIEGLEFVTWRSEDNKVYTMTVGDTTTYDSFEKGVLNSMPTTGGQTTTGTIEMTATNGAQLTYTLTVKYLDPVAKIGEVGYGSLEAAIAASKSGDTIELLKSLTVDNADVSSTPNSAVFAFPAGVNFNGGGNIITANEDAWTTNPAGTYGTNHILGVSSGTATISNVTLIGHANMKSGIVAYGNGTNVTIDGVTSQNCGNCGVQVSGATVVMNNLNASGNAWGAVNADKGGTDSTMPSVTFNSGTMAELVEIYTEITDQEVVTAPSLTKYQGFGTNLKGFIYYTSDVTKFTSQGATIYDGAIYETINDILEKNDTVELSVEADVTQTISVPAGKTLNLNLNNHTISNVVGKDTLTNNGTLTISGTGIIDNTENQKAALVNNGTLTILGGTISRSQDTGVPDDSTHPGYYTLVNHGTMVIGSEEGDNSGILISSTGGYSALVENGWYDSTGKTAGTDDCHLTIYGGSFTGGKYCLKNDELGFIDVYGGDFAGSFDVNVLNWHNLYIHDGTFDATAHNTANVANGKYQLGVGHIEISGGEFTSGSTKTNLIQINGYTSSDITLTGGVFNKKTGLSSYLADGYELDTTINPGKFTVVQKMVASIGDVEYPTVAAAINAITDNTPTTINLVDDVTENLSIPVGRNITISGGASSATITGGITVAASGSADTNVTIEHIDIVSPGASKTYGIISQNQSDNGQMNCNLVLNDCSITGFASKAIYGTNIKTLTMTGCRIENCATGSMDEPNTKGDYAIDLNLIAVQGTVVTIDGCTFTGDLGDKAAIKITQRGGASDAGASDIPKNVGEANIESVTIKNCDFTGSTTEVDFRIGTDNKTPGGDGLNTTGAYAVTIEANNTEMVAQSAYLEDEPKLTIPAGMSASKTAETDLALDINTDEVEQAVDSFIEGLDAEGVKVEADPDINNTYTLTTSNGLLSNTGIFDDIAGVEGVAGITVTDGGSQTATYTAGGDLATFKSAVDAMLPKSNDAAPVVLTMTIDVE